MAKESSFDIVSKVELSEVQNAIQIALKEISTRYDFKGSKSDISLDKEELVLVSDDEFKLSQLKDVLVSKLIKRNVPTKNIDYGKVENASGGTVRQRAKLALSHLHSPPRRCCRKRQDLPHYALPASAPLALGDCFETGWIRAIRCQAVF